MYTIVKRIMLLIFPFLLISCIKESHEDCAVYLEFIFDHNMDYTDLFSSEVEMVDVYVFDKDGYYLFSRHADCATDLINGKRMYLRDGFTPGTYKLITVGGLTNHFRFTDLNDQSFRPGVTTIQEVKLSLYHETSHVALEFPHLWFGETTVVEYKADYSVCPVYLVRETNRFNLALECTDNSHEPADGEKPLYTFEIITPESGAYGHDNTPRVKETVTYHPYHLVTGMGSFILSEAKIRTMRLFADDEYAYRLVVSRTDTGKEVWNYDLMDLLKKSNRYNRPDGTPLPLQEYLDRECEWNLILQCRDNATEGFVAVSIVVNDWIIWLRDIEI